MPFSDFHKDPESRFSVNRIETTIKYQKIVMEKLYLMHKQKSLPWKMEKKLTKNPKKIGKN